MRNSIFTLLIVTLTTLVSISFSSPLTVCDSNEDYYDGKCYDFINATLPISYTAAQDYCRKRGKTLAKITSASVQSFLANSAEMRAWNRAMFGLRLKRDKWTWAKDGSLLSGQGCYVDNNERRDLNLSTAFMYTMKILDCVDYCRAQSTSRFAGLQNGRQCLCGSNFGNLPPTSNCNTPCGGDLNSYCGGQGANYIYAIGGAYSAWEDGRPANDGGCAAMVVGKRSPFPWRDAQCSTQMAHICQFDQNRDTKGVSAYFCFQTTCYALYELQKPWYAARAHCKMLGGDLVKIDTTKIHSEVVSLLSDHLYLGTVWIGASNGKWTWSDDSNVGDYTAWSSYSSQPLVESSTAGCAELSSSETNYNWVARDCEEIAGKTMFICERSTSNYGNEIEAFSAPVVFDPQKAGNGGVVNGLAWYGWFLVGMLLGVVVCMIVFGIIWMFCIRKPPKLCRSKLDSARSEHSSHGKSSGHVCHRHRDGGNSSGIGSSVTSSSSSKQDVLTPDKVENDQTVEETLILPSNIDDKTSTANNNNKTVMNGNNNNAYVRSCGHYHDNVSRDVVTVSMASGSVNRMRVNSGRSNSETRQQGVESRELSAGRRRARKRNDTRVAPSPSGNNGEPTLTPRDPFSIQDDRV